MSNKKISQKILNELGLSTRYLGYVYTLHAIDLIDKDESILLQVNKVLYIEIAKTCSTTPLCVERSIRYSINTIWKHTDNYADFIQEIFGHNYLNKKPSNKVFLELLHNHINSLEPNNLHNLNDKCPLYGCECPVLTQFFISK